MEKSNLCGWCVFAFMFKRKTRYYCLETDNLLQLRFSLCLGVCMVGVGGRKGSTNISS